MLPKDILRLTSLNRGRTLRQSDRTPLKYQLNYSEDLIEKGSLVGKTATVYITRKNDVWLRIETDVLENDIVVFSIDQWLPENTYDIEIVVDGSHSFPSDNYGERIKISRSSFGSNSIIELIPKKEDLIEEILQRLREEHLLTPGKEENEEEDKPQKPEEGDSGSEDDTPDISSNKYASHDDLEELKRTLSEKMDSPDIRNVQIVEQQAPSKSWEVIHNLQGYPTVTVIDNNGYVVYGDINYVSIHKIRVDFTSAFSGKVILNK